MLYTFPQITSRGHLNTPNIAFEKKLNSINSLNSCSYSFCLIILLTVNSIFFPIQGTSDVASYNCLSFPFWKAIENSFACYSEGIHPLNIKLLKNFPNGEDKHLYDVKGVVSAVDKLKKEQPIFDQYPNSGGRSLRDLDAM